MGLLDRLLRRRPKALTISPVQPTPARPGPAEPVTEVLRAVAPPAAQSPAHRGGTTQPATSAAVQPSQQATLESPREQYQAVPAAHVADAQRRHDEQAQGRGEGADPHATGSRSVRGKPHHLWIDTIEQLKREARHDEVLVLLYECIAAAERDRRGGAPAPAYTEHAAIVHRKMRDYDAEIAVINRWLRLAPSNEPKRARMSDRLAKASALRERNPVRA